MSDKDKTRQEPEGQRDWVLRRVLKPTERLRTVQTDLEALISVALGQFQELRENRDEREDATAVLRRLESLLNQAQQRAGEALVLSGHIASAVDSGIREPFQEEE